jgi:hypothetical protein
MTDFLLENPSVSIQNRLNHFLFKTLSFKTKKGTKRWQTQEIEANKKVRGLVS